jgi:micrococcal nuclease
VLSKTYKRKRILDRLGYNRFYKKNYNLEAVEEGWSPYFVKYGRARLYHEQFLQAEFQAQSKNLAIWDPETNAGGNQREYERLIPWWHLRESVVEDYRKFGIQSGAKSMRIDYAEILEAARQQNNITVFCDLQGGINQWTDNGALVYGGSPHHKFNLWIPDPESTEALEIINLIEKRYAGYGRGYVYVNGQANFWPPNGDGKPQIVITDKSQLSDFPPG